MGTSGNFTDITTPSTTYTSAGKAVGDSATFTSVTLPAAAENQSNVQVRWVYWESNGTTGSRDRLAIDDINISVPPPTISINDVSQDEGDGGTTNFNFTVTRSGDTTGASTINYTTADGTATVFNSDYNPVVVPGTVSFAAGETSKTITIAVNGDNANEPNETFFVNLTVPVGGNATLTDSQGQGTIVNDDSVGAFSFSSSAYSVSEGGGNVTLTVNRTSDDDTGTVTVTAANQSATGGTSCTNGVDYVFPSNPTNVLMFGPGVTQLTFNIQICPDSVFEGNAAETFQVNLTTPTGVGSSLGSPSTAQVSISEDDAAPTLGNYANTTIPLSGNATIAPDAAPTNATSVTVSISPIFKGEIEIDPTTGVIRVTNANPAGTYNVIVNANNGGIPTTKTFTLTVTTPAGCDTVNASSFAAPVKFGVGSNPYSVAVGDFNGDGKQDLAVANLNGGTVSVLLRNAANNGFDAKIDYAVGNNPSSVAVGDFNSDGKQDIVAVNSGSQSSVSVLLRNAANNGFEPKADYLVNLYPTAVAVADFNGDGRQDIVTTSQDSGQSSTTPVSVLLRNSSNDGFENVVSYQVGLESISITVGDFNGDGKADIATAANGDDSGISVLLRNAANNGFDLQQQYVYTGGLYSIVTGDFNADGKQDIAVSAPYNNTNTVFVILRNAANNGFDSAIGYPVANNPVSLAVGDFNNDGRQDLVSANDFNGSVSILTRKSDNSGFNSKIDYSFGGSNPYSVAVGDFNGDNRQDIATANYGSNNVSVLQRVCNQPPTITPQQNVSQQQGSPATNQPIATVTDDGGAGNVTVTVSDGTNSFGTSATVNGVTISNIVNNGNGTITADVVAACDAANASFTLQANDGSLTTTSTLNVTVTANAAPTLTYSSSIQTVQFGGSTTVNPVATGDNGTVTYTVQTGHGLTTAPTVDANGVVSITNAQPDGSHTITIQATDNCGLTTTASFTLNVSEPPTVNLSISQNQIAENGGSITITAATTSPVNGNQTVTLTASGTATLNSDYSVSNLTITIPNGATSGSETLTVTDDRIDEADSETAILTITGVSSNLKIGSGASQTLTISDDDTRGLIVNGSPNVTEGSNTSSSFSVKLNSQPTGNVTITPSASAQVTVSPASITFTPANYDTPQTFTVTATDDNVYEGTANETIILTASSADDALYNNLSESIVVVVNDDDAQPGVSFGSPAYTVNENDSAVSITINRTGAAGNSFTVNVGFDASGQTATGGSCGVAGADFDNGVQTISFAANQMSQTVSVSVCDDNIAEGAETFKAVLSNASQPIQYQSPDAAVITIADNDTIDLTVSQQDATDPVNAGGNITYNLTVANGGNTAATGVSVNFAIPSGTTFVSASDLSASGFTNTGNNAGTINFTGGTVGAGQTVNLQVVVSAASGGVVTSFGSGVEVDPDKVIIETNEGNNTAQTITTTVNALPTISPATGISRQQGSPAENLTIATVADNEDGAGSLTVTVNSLPSGISITNIVNSNGTIKADVAADCTASVGSKTVVLQVQDGNGASSTANLIIEVVQNPAPVLSYPPATQAVAFNGSLTVQPNAASDNGTVTYTVQPGHGLTTALTVDANGVVSISNAQPAGQHTVTILATDNCGAFSEASFTLLVAAQPADLSVSIADSPDPVVEGNFLTYTITVSNLGGGAATNVVLNDSLPAGASFVSASSGCVFDANSAVVSCQIGNLANGEQQTRTIVVSANASTAGTTLTNAASVSAAETDPFTDNNTDSETTAVSGAVCVAPPSGMISWFTGENSSDDIYGSNNALATGDAAYAAGKIGQAFSFGGVDGKVSAPDSASLDFTSALTLDAWVYVAPDADASAQYGIVNKYRNVSSPDLRGYELFIKNKKLEFQSGACSVTSASEIVFGQWNHVAATFNKPENGAGECKVFINGLENGTATASGIIAANDEPLTIGASEGGSASFFKGKIDEVELFNRALDESEIAAIYNASAAGKCHAASLQFSTAEYSVNENGGSAAITVTRTGAKDTAVSVNYATIAGGSASGDDFTSSAGTLNFAPGEQSKTFSVPVNNDNVDESDETVNLELSNVQGSGATLGSPASAVLTITDEDTASVIVSKQAVNVTEGGAADSYSIKLGSQPTANVTVTVQPSDQLSASPTTLVFTPANYNVAQTVSVSAIDDNVYETAQNGYISHSASSDDSSYDDMEVSTLDAIIGDNDAQPSVNFAAATYSVNENAGTINVTVNRSGAAGNAFDVSYALNEITATGGICGTNAADFNNTSGTISFAANQTSQNLTVQICDDSNIETNETFAVNLTAATNNAAVGSQSQTIVTITENDFVDLTIAQEAPANVVGNTNFDYVLRASNGGNVGASGFNINFTLPSAVTFVSATSSNAVCASVTQTGGAVQFSGCTAAAGETISVKVTVKAPVSEQIVTSAGVNVVVDSNNAVSESNEENNKALDAQTNVSTAVLPDLSIVLKDTPARVYVNYPLTYTLEVSNTGTAAASNVSVDFKLPTGVPVSFESASNPSNNGFTAVFDANTNTVHFTGGTISGGSAPTVSSQPNAAATLTVTVKPLSNGTLTSNAGDAAVDAGNSIQELNEANNATTGSVQTQVEFVPTASGATVGGKVLSRTGKPIARAKVILTDASGASVVALTNRSGNFVFENVPSGETYILSISSRFYQFAEPTRVITVSENIEEIIFTAY